MQIIHSLNTLILVSASKSNISFLQNYAGNFFLYLSLVINSQVCRFKNLKFRILNLLDDHDSNPQPGTASLNGDMLGINLDG